MTSNKNVYEAFVAVMADVKAIEKSERNQQQGFTFRGIDNVMQIIGPALRAHQVFIVPNAENITSETYQTKSGTTMQNVTVTMRYTVYGPGGDKFEGTTFGQSADAGDKAVTKAQSVALRTFLLQSLMVPTGDADPDAYTHERAAGPVSPLMAAKQELWQLLQDKGIAPVEAIERFAAKHGGELKDTQDVTAVEEMVHHYREMSGG